MGMVNIWLSVMIKINKLVTIKMITDCLKEKFVLIWIQSLNVQNIVIQLLSLSLFKRD